MILFSHGTKRRAAAGLCAAVLIAALVVQPLQARAAATAAAAGLVAVGAVVTVTAFLNACGVYPYLQDTSFGEWGAQSLAELWSQYVSSFEGGQTPSGGTVETFNAIKSFVVDNTLAVASATWDELRSFASWIVSTFSVTDSQTGVKLGVTSYSLLNINQIDTLTLSGLASQGTLINRDTIYSYTRYLGASTSDVFAGLYSQGSGSNAYNLFVASNSPANYYFNHKDSALGSQSFEGGSLHYNGSYGFCIGTWSNFYFSAHGATSIPLFSNFAAAVAAFRAGGALAGVTADTAVVSVPCALPEGAQFGGLQVAELGAGATVQALEDVIEDGVIERQQPVVLPVEVEIGTGVQVDTDTGAVTENPVTITPDSVALTSSEFALPAAISTVFPFSVPWDIMRVYQALDAEPAFPEIHAHLYVPGSSMVNPDYVDDKIPFTIGIPEDMKVSFDAFAAKFRSIALLLACIGVTWAMIKFIRY